MDPDEEFGWEPSECFHPLYLAWASELPWGHPLKAEFDFTDFWKRDDPETFRR